MSIIIISSMIDYDYHKDISYPFTVKPAKFLTKVNLTLYSEQFIWTALCFSHKYIKQLLSFTQKAAVYVVC